MWWWGRNNPTIFPENWIPLPGGDPGIPPTRLHQSSPLEAGGGGTCSALRHNINIPRPCVHGKPTRQKREDQTGLKETVIDCRSLVATNRLPRATLGHHLTLPGTDQEWEDSSKQQMLLRQIPPQSSSLFSLFFLIILYRGCKEEGARGRGGGRWHTFLTFLSFFSICSHYLTIFFTLVLFQISYFTLPFSYSNFPPCSLFLFLF